MIEIPKQLKDSNFKFIKLRKGRKEPIETDWQNTNNYSYDDPMFQEHLKKGNNYGIVGGFGNLILIDSDSEVITEMAEQLPETFTVKTGSPESYKKHYFFRAEKKIKPIRLSKHKLGDLGDVRSVGQYVVGCNSVHPKGDNYRIEKDLPIAYITELDIREMFFDFIDKKAPTKFVNYEINKGKRVSKYITHCNMPNFLKTHKLNKGNTAKNWKLFRYVADILYNRGTESKEVNEIVKMQGHSAGAIKGWFKTAQEGKLAKSSCKTMSDYITNYYPELEKDICGNCPNYELCKAKKPAENEEDLKDQIVTLFFQKFIDWNLITEKIKDGFLKDNHIYTTRDDDRTEMWIYKEGIYIPQGKTYVNEFCKEILKERLTPQICNKVIFKIEVSTYIDQNEFFNNNHINYVPVNNGLLNILTGELENFDPKLVFFNKLPVNYDQYKDCPNIIKHLMAVLKSEDDLPVMQELFGFLLYKDYKFEKAFMMTGGGRNGKGKTVELMKRFLGADNCCNVTLQQIEKDAFALVNFHGKMANLGADISSTGLQETGNFKSLTGHDLISANRKNKTYLNFVNYAKMVFCANEIPYSKDMTTAFFNRWILLEFPYTFIPKKEYDMLTEDEIEKGKFKLADPKQIEYLTDPDELSGLLNWALEGLWRLLENKGFSYSKSTDQVKNLWVRKTDSLMAFIEDCCKLDYNNIIPKHIFKETYQKYCDKHKIKCFTDKTIKSKLNTTYDIDEERKTINSKTERCWVGISL